MGNSSGVPQIDYTNKDYDSLRLAMLALAKRKLPEWKDHSANDPGVALLELFAYMGDMILYYQDRIANESFLDTASERRSVMNLLRLIGCEMRPAQPASVDLILLFKPDFNPKSSKVTIKKNSKFTTAGIDGESVSFLYVRNDLTIDIETLPVEEYKGNSYRCYEGLPVIQVDSIHESKFPGPSDGSSGQRYELKTNLLIANTLEVYVGNVRWERKDTLFFSCSDDRHFVVRRDEEDYAWIEFGDNRFGKIPPPGTDITASYMVGGGIKGNVPGQSDFNAIYGVNPASDLKLIINDDAASGGMEHEDIAQAALRGPQLFRARSRAVTAEDYETFARDFGVAKARARAANWNRIELYVAPAGGGIPSATMKEDLRLYFEDKRMLGAIIEVNDPKYPEIEIKLELYVKPQYLKEYVRLETEEALRALLAFDQMDFAVTLYISKVYEVIEAIEGVEGVIVTKFKRNPSAPDGVDPNPAEGVLRFGWNEIPRFSVSNVNFEVFGGHSED